MTLKAEIVEGETLGGFLDRYYSQNPEAIGRIFNSDQGKIYPPVVTSFNGVITPRTEAIQKTLNDGDMITWFLMYAGG